MKIKRFINSILACAMVCTAVPYVSYSVPENISITANAVDEAEYTEGTYENLTYKAYEDHIEISDCDESTTEVKIPSEIDGLPVTVIGDKSFNCCSELIKVTIPDSVTSIGSYAFNYCFDLTEITIPDSVTSIGNYAFSNCTSLIEINIPDSVTSIGNSAFNNCSRLTSITIPDSVTSIGNYSVPADDEWGGYIFNFCPNLKEINVSEGNKNYSSKNGVLFNKEMTKLIRYPEGKLKTEYIIPESVKVIEKYTFMGCSNLTSVTIPDSVTSIEAYAFSDCTSLTSIKIPNSVTSIEAYAFYNCSNLTSVTIPDSVTSIEAYAFYNCSNLTSVTIPDSVTSIGASAFDSSGLKSITIPNSVTSIEDWAFCDCSSLTSITIENPECYIYDDSATISNDIFGDIYNGTIYGHENSTAQAYAEKYDRNFVILGKEQTTNSTEKLSGDANGDGNIDIADVVSISAYVGDSEKNPLDEQSILNGDVQNTGDGLTANDALMIQQYLSGNIATLE